MKIAALALTFLVGILVCSIASAEKFDDYYKAAEASRLSGKPLVIVLSGQFCPWCEKQKMELNRGIHTEFNWVVVPAKLYPQYTIKGKGIPQLCILTKVGPVWTKKTYVGYKETKRIKELIKWHQKKK